MKVFYKKGRHVIVYFPARELKQALQVLKALAQYFKAAFLFDVAEDLERDLTPQLPSPPVYHHICENCFMEIDVRKDSYVHVDSAYLHTNCPILKENRPV